MIGSSTNITGSLQPCPIPSVLSNPVCVDDENAAGRYFASFVPLVSGNVTISVYLGHVAQGQLLNGAKFVATIYPSDVFALNTVVMGK